MVEQKRIFSKDLCSGDFYESFRSAGTSTSVVCEACGRHHFTENNSLKVEGEDDAYKTLIEGSQKSPDSYIAHEGDNVSYTKLMGMDVVFECPCNFARAVEDFIKQNKSRIFSYLKKEIEENFKKAEKDKKALDALTEK
ncbi:MAG: hypothetical protein KBB86_03230 [Candidatus Pacebacteria bacterium]|nr:hypothetical protein [Candidatus Paceibacterota bacterium]